MLEVQYLKIKDLKPDEQNAKLHPEWQVEQIKKSIEKFGMNDPIAIGEDNIIIEGHGRYEACLQLGISKVPVIRLDELDEQQRKAYALVHNKLTMNTDFDIDVLRSEIESIKETDLADFGFNLEEAQTYFDEDKPEKAEEIKKAVFVIYFEKNRLQELKNLLDEKGYKYKI